MVLFPQHGEEAIVKLFVQEGAIRKLLHQWKHLIWPNLSRGLCRGPTVPGTNLIIIHDGKNHVSYH